VTYDKEKKRDLLEDGFAIYKAFASQLTWGSYFRLLKKLLYKLQTAFNQVNSISAHGAPELEREKLITKCICSVLSGFNFDDVPDAVESANA
jgi:hypothetical protein